MQITPHFTDHDLTFSSAAVRLVLDNTPPQNVLNNATQAAQGMEKVRALLGGLPIHIDSWIRMPAVNKAIGGALDSDHMHGWAIDFLCNGFGTPDEIVAFLAASSIKFDKLIKEGGWVHISFNPLMRQIMMTAHFAAGKPTTYTQGV